MKDRKKEETKYVLILDSYSLMAERLPGEYDTLEEAQEAKERFEVWEEERIEIKEVGK